MNWWNNRAKWQKITIIWVGALIVIGAIFGSSATEDEAAPTSTTSSSQVEAAATEPPADTATTAAVTTETPTTAPPATTSTTTTTSTTSTTTTTLAAFSEAIIIEGSGADVIDTVVPGDTIAIVKITHTGSRHFSVWSYAANGDRIDLLVNETGAYEGRRPVNLLVGEEISFMEVDADGSWTIELQPLFMAKQMTSGMVSGTGDDVVVDIDPPSTAARTTITHNGQRHFAIWLWSADDRDLLVNETGQYTGTVLGVSGGVLYDISADGDWTIERE